jgi:hypothetical protein
MEKINALIEKLQELKNSGADLSAISYYAQLLQAEVLHARNRQHQQQAQQAQGNIAVIMPAQQPVVTMSAQATTLPSNKPLPVQPAVEAKREEDKEDINSRAARLNNTPTFNTIITTTEDINSRAAKAQEQAPLKTAATLPVADEVPPKPEPVVTAQPIPTLAVNQPVPQKQKPAPAATLFDAPPAAASGNSLPTAGSEGLRKDLNDLVGANGLSLNDRLRQEKVEVAQKLGDMPINDLRNAIGINDKYQFIQELFRGDRDLYERSIKTINECDNLQEADYWIQREIKIIQGWEDDHHLVQHFYSLLKKRFS